MAFKFYHSCLSKQIHHTRFFEFGVITLPTPSHLELMCVIRNLIVLVSYHLFSAQPLQACFTVLFWTYIKIILHDSVWLDYSTRAMTWLSIAIDKLVRFESKLTKKLFITLFVKVKKNASTLKCDPLQKQLYIVNITIICLLCMVIRS